VTRHRFDPFSFIAGGIAVSVAVAVLVGAVSIRLLDLRIAGPVLVLLLGLALLLGGGRDRGTAEEVGAPQDDAARHDTTDAEAEA
jgi:hypothetical protein